MAILIAPPSADVRITKFFTPGVVLTLVVFMGGAAIGLSRPGTNVGAAISDVAHFVNGETFDSKSLLILTGLVCGICYFASRYVYLYAYADKIWDAFFARKNDQLYFFGIVGMQLASTVVLVLFPHYWYLNVLLLNLCLLVIVRSRYEEYLSVLRNNGFDVERKPLSILKDSKPAEDDAECAPILARLYLLRSGVRHLIIRGFLFDGLFYVMIATCHVLRRVASDPFDLFFVGMYCSAALLFTVVAVVNNGIAGWMRLTALSERAAQNDFRYFSALLR